MDTDIGVFTADQLILRINDVGVTGLGGRLDGNWNNPNSLIDMESDTFPSGNNVVDADDDFVFWFTIMSGDFNHDNIVNNVDFVIWRKFEGTTSGATHSMGDADGDGDVDGSDDDPPGVIKDYDIWQMQFGLNFTVWPSP